MIPQQTKDEILKIIHAIEELLDEGLGDDDKDKLEEAINALDYVYQD